MSNEILPQFPLSSPDKKQPIFDALSDEEQTAVQIKLWQFLGKRTQRYTMGDSSSVPVEMVQELFESICFTLELYQQANGLSATCLLTERVEDLFQEGLKLLEAKTAQSKQLWETACFTSPNIENISYRDTLQGINGFWKRYDYHFFAHEIFCEIDYQLCHPIPDALRGVLYVNEYLHHILIENQILHLFHTNTVISLLEQYCPDYKGLLINLCEPVLVNAIGLAILRKPSLLLKLSENEQATLTEFFAALPPKSIHKVLSQAAQRFYEESGINDPFTQEYILQTAQELPPRIEAALPSGSLAGIFIPFESTEQAN